MKKVLALLLAMVLVLSLAACGGSSSSGDTSAETSANEENLNELFIGKWKSEAGQVIAFFKDGSCIFPKTSVTTPNPDHQLFKVYENHSVVFAYYGAGSGGIDYSTYIYEIGDDILTIDDVKYKKL